MKIIDTYPDLVQLYDEMNGAFCIDKWENYASGISKNLPAELKADGVRNDDFKAQILLILTQAINNRNALMKAHDAFVVVTMDIEERCREVFQADLDADIIFYMGLCNGAGWATILDGRHTVLLGVEKIIELEWHDEKRTRGLIYHELGHILHFVKGHGLYEPVGQREKSIWQLYQEGIAMYCEQLLWGDFESYHQNVDDWLDWCIVNKSDILCEYKKRMRDNESTQDFFGDWTQWRGRSNLGYYLGCEFVKSLAAQYSLDKLLYLSISEVGKEFDGFELQPMIS